MGPENQGDGASFLATTALEEFWDPSRPQLFLGEWCLRYSRKEYWQELRGELIGSPWESAQQLHDARGYVADLYEGMLPQLGEALNRLHGNRHSARYWRIVLGPWLHPYLAALYDRFVTVKAALARHPGLTTTVLAPESWVTPRDTLEFVQLLKEDPYNLQLFSAILETLGHEFPAKPFQVAAAPFAPRAVRGLAASLEQALTGLVIKANRGFSHGHAVILRNSYLPVAAELKLIAGSLGRVWPLVGPPAPAAWPEPERPLRSRFHLGAPEGDEFQRLLARLIPVDLPSCFLEGFRAVGERAAQDYPAPPRVIASANAWYYDEAFKRWAAGAAERGSALVGLQHGGNYGSVAFLLFQSHETAITDRYFSWGWARSDTRAEVTPFPAAKLSGRKRLPADNGKRGILLATTSAPRFLFEFPQAPERFSRYLQWQSRFVHALPAQLILELRVRHHREDLGWDIARRWSDFAPQVAVEGWEVGFEESLANCRIYVGDHLSTTFLEALSADKPTLLFWEPAINELRPEAEPYYQRLREAGILYDSPEAAAQALAEIYPDVAGWWQSPERQQARAAFCDRFARTSPDAVRLWAEQFRRLAAGELSAAPVSS